MHTQHNGCEDTDVAAAFRGEEMKNYNLIRSASKLLLLADDLKAAVSAVFSEPAT